jgi:phospholipid/cholesterol/gamma-HCH transport system substrate-binding protein
MVKRALLRLENVSTVRIGAVLLVVSLLLGFALFQKGRIFTTFRSGEKVQADFSRDYRVRPYVTKVKIAGVKVGVVTSVDHESGHTRITMKVDKGTTRILRAAPSAAIRPTTLLGGNYYVALQPGGDPASFAGVIPTSRTTTPVELDRVLETLQPAARTSLQRTIPELGSTLDARGQRQVKGLLADAPDALTPAGKVLSGLRGTNPDDLTTIVEDLGATARAMTRNNGELQRSLTGLDSLSSVLDRESGPIARSIDLLPSSLQTARTGLDSLDSTLDQVKATAEDARPIARQLGPLMDRLGPALTAARPVVRDLRPTLGDIRPVVEQLVHSASLGTRVLSDVNGGPLSRLNGPIMKTFRSPWSGTGQYAGGGNSTPFYQELANTIAGMDNASRMTDHNGSTIHFQPGFGLGSVSGLPISFEQLVKSLLYPGGVR